MGVSVSHERNHGSVDSLKSLTASELTGLRRRAVKGGVVLVASRMAVQIITWGVTFLVARYLRPYDYGVLTAGGIFIGLSDRLAEAGIGKALVQKKHISTKDLAEGFTFSLAISLFLYAVLFVIAGPASAFLRNPDLVNYLRAAGLLLVLTPFHTVRLALLERRLQFGHRSVIHVITALGRSSFVLVLAATGWGYWSLIVGTMVGRMFETVALTYCAPWWPRISRPRWSSGGLLSFGIHVSGASILWFIYSNSDYTIVARMTNPADLGYYALAFMLITLPVRKITANFNQVAYPVFCRLKDDPVRLRNWYLRMVSLLGVLGLPLLVGMALMAGDGVPGILGEKWQSAVLPLQMLSIVGMVMLVSTSITPLFNTLGRPDINLKYAFICVLVLSPSFCVMASVSGISGVCLAWVVLYPIIVGSFITLNRRLLGFGVIDIVRAIFPILCAVIFMSFTVTTTQWIVKDDQSLVTRLTLPISIGVISYVSFTWIIARRTIFRDVNAIWREFRSART